MDLVLWWFSSWEKYKSKWILYHKRKKRTSDCYKVCKSQCCNY